MLCNDFGILILIPATHAPLPHTPPFTHAPRHACPLPRMPPTMHAPIPCMPPGHAHLLAKHTPWPCTPPCHAHPTPCMPPMPHGPLAMHTLQSCTPPTMKSPLPCMSPFQACSLPCMPPAIHVPPWTDRHLWKHYLRKLRLQAVTRKHCSSMWTARFCRIWRGYGVTSYLVPCSLQRRVWCYFLSGPMFLPGGYGPRGGISLPLKIDTCKNSTFPQLRLRAVVSMDLQQKVRTACRCSSTSH